MKKAGSAAASTYSGQRFGPRRWAAAPTASRAATTCAAMSDHFRLLVLHPQRTQIDAGVDEREQHDQQRIAGGYAHVVVVAIPRVGLTGEDRQVAAGERDHH